MPQGGFLLGESFCSINSTVYFTAMTSCMCIFLVVIYVNCDTQNMNAFNLSKSSPSLAVKIMKPELIAILYRSARSPAIWLFCFVRVVHEGP